MRWSSRRTVLLAVAVAVAVASVAGVLIWRAKARAADEREFRSRTQADWREISQQADRVQAAVVAAESPSDFPKISEAAASMQQRVERAAASREKSGAPGSYGEAARREREALGALTLYLEKLGTFAQEGEGADLAENRGLIENAARAARDNVDGFLASAGWVTSVIPGDFYGSTDAMASALEPVDPALEAQRQSAYDAAYDFMYSDIFLHDFDRLLASISNRLRVGFDYYKITKEKLQADWAKAWDYRPVNFTISRPQITFPSPDSAVVKAIAYVEKGPPKIAEMRLVDEGGWKIDSYPFVGWD